MLHEKILYSFGRQVIKLYSSLMFDLDVKQLRHLPTGPKIFVSNHPSSTDPFLAPTFFSDKTSLLVKESLFNIPFFGRYLKYSGHIPVNTNKGTEVMRQAIHRLNKGQSVMIYIEGDISPLEGGFRRPHTGAARLAISQCVPIIPIGVSLNRDQIKIINTSINNNTEVGTVYYKGPYAATIGRPLYFLGDHHDRPYVQQVTQKIMSSIIHLSAQSHQRLTSPKDYTLNSII